MRIKLLIVSIVAICAAVLLQLSIWDRERTAAFASVVNAFEKKSERTVDTQSPDMPPNEKKFPGFPLKVTQTIDLNSDEGARNRFSDREWRDQVRDWLLLAVLGDSGLSAYDIASATFDLPPLRYGYLKASGRFEYGESRSCYIGDGQILALVPADVSQDSRDDAIADIVDSHRKDQVGEISSVEVFEYRLLADKFTAEITHLDSLDVATYLDAKKGYYEATVNSLDDLRQLLQKIDDLTYAKITPNGLLLGGRKLLSYEFRGIDLQEVAAIWLSEQDIARKEKEFQEYIEQENSAYQERWSDYNITKKMYKLLKPIENQHIDILNNIPQGTGDLSLTEITNLLKGRDALSSTDINDLLMNKLNRKPASTLNREQALQQIKVEADSDYERIKKKIQNRAQELHLVNGSGFSLDPDYDYPGLSSYLDDLLINPEKLVSSETAQSDDEGLLNKLILPIFEKKKSEITDAVKALKKKDIIPLLTIIEELKASGSFSDLLFAEYFNGIADKFKYQAARYDGELQGTEAGMVLFYTDLIAKIWSMDYLNSAPGNIVEDFVDDTQVKIAKIYDKENRELPAARLWFGPTDHGFQVEANTNQLFFQRISTRIFSKGNNPLDPKNEVQTSAFLAAAIDWWDDHYQEVARYEPEYFRLNEIMKWSLVIGFLADDGKENQLNFLKEVEVDHSNWFTTWAKNNKALKFDLWNQIKFYEEGYKGTSTEAMEMLYGKVTSGGVSLAPKTLFKNRTQISPSISKFNRRSNIDYDSVLKGTGGEFKTLDGIAVKLEHKSPKVASVTNTPKPGMRLRATDSDLLNTPFERIISKTKEGLTVKAHAGSTRLGNLNIDRTANGFKIGWQSRDIDAGQTLVLRASRSSNPESVFTSDPLVRQLVKLDTTDTYAIKMSNSDKWLVAKQGGGGDSTVGGGWQSRVADPDGGSSYLLKWMDKKAVDKEINKSNWVTFRPSPDKRLVIADLHPRGPPKQGLSTVDIAIGKKSVTATIDPASGLIYIPSKKSRWLLDIQREFTPKQLKRITSSSADKTNTKIQLTDSRSIEEAVNKVDYRRIASEIVKDSEKAGATLDHMRTADINIVTKLLAKDKPGSAIIHLAKMKKKYGQQAEFDLWEVFCEISRKNISRAERILKGTNRPGKTKDFNILIKEIQARLANPLISKQTRINLENLENYTKWRNISSQKTGDAIPIIRDGVIEFEFHLFKPIQKKKFLSDDEAYKIAESKIPFYRHDSSALNNLDWSTSQVHAFKQTIEMKLGKVVELPKGEIATLNPSKIVTPINHKTGGGGPSGGRPNGGGSGGASAEFIRTGLRLTNPGASSVENEECTTINDPNNPSPDCIHLLVDQAWDR